MGCCRAKSDSTVSLMYDQISVDFVPSVLVALCLWSEPRSRFRDFLDTHAGLNLSSTLA